MGPGRDQTRYLLSDSLPTALWGPVLIIGHQTNIREIQKEKIIILMP